MLKQNYFLADIFILSAEKQPIKLSWRKIECLQFTLQESHGHVTCIIQPQEIVIYLRIFLPGKTDCQPTASYFAEGIFGLYGRNFFHLFLKVFCRRIFYIAKHRVSHIQQPYSSCFRQHHGRSYQQLTVNLT